MLSDLQIRSIASSRTAVIYDGECPFCSSYVRWVRLRKSVGPVSLIDARSLPADLLKSIRDKYDLDQGMVFIHGERTYWGADAIHALSLLSGDGFFTRLCAALFQHQILARVIYPILRLGRNIAIHARGKGTIHPQK